ncbi:MAG: hypothetical protein H7Z19_15310 [Chitinophagaceae bacterium]|nr:hypothetical protein [Rubrivivax sp.]
MTATHATRVENLTPRIDRRADMDRARAALAEAIISIHGVEHANVWLTSCANPICVAYVALGRAGS